MTLIRALSVSVATTLFCLALAGPLRAAARCGGDFETWLAEFQREAAAQGISQRAIAASLDGLTPDPAVISRDNRQGVFTQTFEQFSGRMISPDRMRRGTVNRLLQCPEPQEQLFIKHRKGTGLEQGIEEIR